VAAFIDAVQRNRSAEWQAALIKNQLAGPSIAAFLATMVTTFTSFHPLGVVLVALLGVGVAEHTGFINAALKWMLSFTSAKLLTPMLIMVGIVSHTAADAGYVLVIPLGGVIFYAAGRHPLAGIAAAFAGVRAASARTSCRRVSTRCSRDLHRRHRRSSIQRAS
jgi:p-aminobenzoyl-glutamate transporter AbgT